MTDAVVSKGSDPKYINRTRNINKAAIGKLSVVGYGFDLIVTTMRKRIGNRQKKTWKRSDRKISKRVSSKFPQFKDCRRLLFLTFIKSPQSPPASVLTVAH